MTSFPDLGEGLLDGGGEMRAQLRALDRGGSPLGSFEGWPPTLRTAVSLVLGSEAPAFATWGDAQLLFFNDAFKALLDPGRTPSLGRPAREILDPASGPLAALIDQVRGAGDPVRARIAVAVPREEGTEERLLAVALCALRDETGEGGVFAVCEDVTASELAARRLARLAEITAALRQVPSAGEAFRLVGERLLSDPGDTPFALFYQLDPTGGEAALSWAAGCPPGTAAAPQRVSLSDQAAGWPLATALGGTSQVVELRDDRLGMLPGGPWPEAARQAVVLPLRVGDAVAAAVVAGVGSRRRVERGLLTFLETVAAQVAHALAEVQVRELRRELRRSAEEKEQAESARRAAESESRAKDEFIAVVSHELRAPLGSILIWSQLLKGETPDEATLARALGMIERSTRTLAQLIDDLLDASRIIAGKLQVEKAPVDARLVVEQAVDSLRMSAANKGLSLQLSMAIPSARVSGDSGRMQQVVVNLLSNAIKFTPEGGRIEVRLLRRGAHLQIEVSDTGGGITPEFLPYIFDRFSQRESPRPQKGLGLGLSIARHLVELHGGSIAAMSPGEGRGATFVVTLPALDLDGPLADAPADESRTGGRPLEGVRLLLVDDEQDAREAVTVLLKQAGAAVHSAGSAAEAMSAVESGPIDVILSDIAMPVEDGYVLIRKIRAHPRTAHTPALALTAYATEEDRGKALRAGYDQHMAKPVDPSQLIAAVAALCRGPVRR